MPADATGPARRIDVRPVEEPPFDAIVTALGDLEDGDAVEVVTGAVPLALLDALEARGWPYEAVRVAPGEWRVRAAAAGDDDPGGEGRSAGRPTRRPGTDRPSPSTHS